LRLPADTYLLVAENADASVEDVWREERMPVVTLGAEFGEKDFDALPTATIVVCGEGAQAAAHAARLGFRTFLVGDSAPDGVRAVSVAETIAAARGARARERWKAARAAGSDG
jgi:hypothetical protein